MITKTKILSLFNFSISLWIFCCFSLDSYGNSSNCYRSLISNLSKPELKNYLSDIELGKKIFYVLGKYKIRRKSRMKYLTGFYLYSNNSLYFLELNKTWLRNKSRLRDSITISLEKNHGKRWKWKKNFLTSTKLSLIKLKLVSGNLKVFSYDKKLFNKDNQKKYAQYVANFKDNKGRKIANSKPISFNHFQTKYLSPERSNLFYVNKRSSNYDVSINLISKNILRNLNNYIKSPENIDRHLNFLENRLETLSSTIRPGFRNVEKYYENKRDFVAEKIKNLITKLDYFSEKIYNLKNKRFEWDTFYSDEVAFLHYKQKVNHLKSKLIYLEDDLDFLNYNERKLNYIFNNLTAETDIFNHFFKRQMKSHSFKFVSNLNNYKLKLNKHFPWMNFNDQFRDYFTYLLDYQRLVKSKKHKVFSYNKYDFYYKMNYERISRACKKNVKKLTNLKTLLRKISSVNK
jgi:hypothetical protein